MTNKARRRRFEEVNGFIARQSRSAPRDRHRPPIPDVPDPHERVERIKAKRREPTNPLNATTPKGR